VGTEISNKPILCLDFDGVCHSYVSGWINAWTIPDDPVPGLFEFIEQAQQHFRVAVYSSRSEFERGRQAMLGWFEYHAGDQYSVPLTESDAVAQRMMERGAELLARLEFPAHKPAALVTIDDRAVTFTGTWPDIGMLRGFIPWNQHLKRRPNSEKAANPAPKSLGSDDG
jgi:hypothetical protein